MTLLENWRNKAYGEGTDNQQKEALWKDYFVVEKGIYEKLLADRLPAEEHDVPVDAVVTEKTVYRWRR